MEHRAHLAAAKSESWRDSVAQPAKVSPGLLECGQGNVLCEHEPRPALGDDSRHLGPQVPFVGCAESLACGAPGLAGEAAAHDVDSPSPGGSVEGSDVVMDGEGFKDSVALPRLEHAPAVGLNLDSTDASVAEQKAA